MGSKIPYLKFAPIPLRKFRSLVQEHGFTIEQTSKEWKIIDSKGLILSTFAVTHNKRSKSNEVKPIYIRQFLAAIQVNKYD